MSKNNFTSLMLAFALICSNLMPVFANDNPALHNALQAAEWIKAHQIQHQHGKVWPVDPEDKKTIDLSLYSGTPGVVLFFLELYRATGKRAYLQDAAAGADYLLQSFAGEKEGGLYTGIAGIGFTLQETYKVTGDKKYRQGALSCAQTLQQRAIKTGSGVQWNDTTDIIAGNAGIGLFLLYAARELKTPAFRDLAVQAGARLIELGQTEGKGMKWMMEPAFPRLMPNFAHGTAGIAYFLATIYGETKRKEFLTAALAGATYLTAVAKTDNNTFAVFHNEPNGKDLYYLSWCHGPAGTARLFYRLYKVTGDRSWLALIEKSAQAIMTSGIPEQQTPGFWNNVSQCCGSAGVAEFFLQVHRLTRNPKYLAFAERVSAHLMMKATRDEKGIKWMQAEHRSQPKLVVAQTGYMQGAAGIGAWLLHYEAFQKGKPASITLPDSPF